MNNYLLRQKCPLSNLTGDNSIKKYAFVSGNLERGTGQLYDVSSRL